MKKKEKEHKQETLDIVISYLQEHETDDDFEAVVITPQANIVSGHGAFVMASLTQLMREIIAGGAKREWIEQALDLATMSEKELVEEGIKTLQEMLNKM